ncbi:MAG: hydantoinase/oxoprolinase family protein [Alphaproteobacteria bacterium]
MKLVGVDVGGTFTDLVFTDTTTNQTIIHKVPTTPHDPSEGVMSGLLELCERNGIDRATIDHVLHGTTIATNAVLEHDGSLTGMVTTKGYRDIIHIGRHQRPEHYSIMQEIPWQDRPLIKRRHRKTVAERIAPPKGEVLVALDENDVRVAARALKAEGVEAIAVCFLFSYIDPSHEDRAKAIILEEFPEAFVTTSSDISPQFREFERFTTAAMNAFVGPKVRNYVKNLANSIAASGLKADLHIMGSNGGVATASLVAERPVLTLLSGPAAGVLGGAWCGALSDRNRLITFDVGGTSADIGIVTDGRFGEATARDTSIAGFPLMVPMIDIHTIGAGGGSIAWRDAGGTFRVGPRSAGSQPGPAAYGRGGKLPTVTDANVVLGRLSKDNFLGGEMTLDGPAAEAVVTDFAKTMDLTVHECAEGILTIINASMANAIRSRTVQKGIDPREYALVAFGGAGPLHGAEVAAELGIAEVIIPPYPGITSAVGLLTTDHKYDAIKTEFQVEGGIDLPRINQDFDAMEDNLRGLFKAEGLSDEEMAFQRAGDFRYAGQGYELRIDFPAGQVDNALMVEVFNRFHEMHLGEYGQNYPDTPVELVNVRVTGVGRMPKIQAAVLTESSDRTLDAALVRRDSSMFRVEGELQTFETPYYRRELLPLNQDIPGPAIVLQKDTTTVVPPTCTFSADQSGNLFIHVGEK